jgi:hypothetical protein
MEFTGSLPTEDNENQILTDYLPILSPNPEFSWRLGSGCCCAPARAFTPINRSVQRPPEHFSPLPLSFPIQPIGIGPTRSLLRQAKHRRRLPELLHSCRRDNQSRRTPGASQRHRRFQSRGPAVVSFPGGRPIHANPLVRIYATPALFLATLHRGPFIVARPSERRRTPAMALPCGSSPSAAASSA